MASYVDITNTLNFSVAFAPTSAFPLDSRSMFGSYQAAAAAAATAENAGSTNTKYYIGQMLTVFENDIVSHYSIQADKTLKAIGAAVIGDEKTVTIGDAGEVGLKSFGVEYFRYIAKDNILSGDYTYPDNMPTDAPAGAYVKVGDVWYVKGDADWEVADSEPVTVARYELTRGWKSGLEPKVIQNSEGSGYELAWYEPSSTTVEGLQSTITSLQNDMNVLNTKVDNNKTELQGKIDEEAARAEAAEAALVGRVESTESAITTLNADAGTEGSIKNQIATAVAGIMENPDESMNSIKELVDWCTNHAQDALELSNNVTANATAISALESLVGTLPEGTSASNVISYIAEAVKVETDRATAAEEALSGRIDTLESTTANLGTAATKNIEDFATAAQGAKADTAVQSVVKSTTNGNVSVDGTDVEVYTLPKATVTDLGGIKVDGSSITTNSDGVASVAAVAASKVTGLDTLIEGAKTGAVSEAKEYVNTNAVLVSNIVDSTNVAGSVEAASTGKVVSEELLLKALNWKTSMDD